MSLKGKNLILYLCADESIYLSANCQDPSQRKSLILNGSRTFMPADDSAGSLGDSSHRWNSMWINHITVSSPTSVNMAHGSNNPRITFTSGTTQNVHILYTDYDSYRAPAGLKVVGDQASCWFEVAGPSYLGSLFLTNTGSYSAYGPGPISNYSGVEGRVVFILV